VLGGSAAIVASGLAKLGVSTTLVAVVGDDEFGRITTGALAAAGVDTSRLRVDAAQPTGISVILSSEDRAILTLPGTLALTSADEVRAAVEATDPAHVHFASFFLLPGLAAELPALLAELRDRGVTTSLDTNWDPAERWDGLASVLPLVDFLLPNDTELVAIATAFVPLDGDARYGGLAAAAALSALGPTVVVKAGSAGGWSMDARGVVERAPGLVVEVVDTTGAGDSFDAGFLAAIAHGVGDPAARLRWAAVAGSLSTLDSGGTAGQADLETVRARLGG
jgi:ribokinase